MTQHNVTPQPETLTPPNIHAEGNLVVIDGNAYTVERPLNAVRWVIRDGERILQQCWSVAGQDSNGWQYRHEDWRDVPTVDERA